MQQVVLSLSGGMDSSCLALNYLRRGYEVTAISFNYGQKHSYELSCAKRLVTLLQHHNLPITHTVIDIQGLTPLLHSSLVVGGSDVPEGHYEQENMRETVVPNRNKIFSSIVQAVALSRAVRLNVPVSIALGIHAGDHAVYPDCREEFRAADYEAFVLGNWEPDRVTMEAPYLDMNKTDILKDAIVSCEALGLDFDDVLRNTNTSYKPILHGPRYYADFKSASSVERIEAFINIDRADPVRYADEYGPVDWDYARTHVMGVLNSVA